MKQMFTLLAWAVLSTSLHAGLVIVQDVVSKGTGMDMNMQLVMQIQDEGMRMDMGEQMSMIVDGKTGDVISLMHAQKMAMVMKGDQLAALTAQMSKEMGEPGEPKPTGNKETIRGYATEEYVQEHAGNKIRTWLAKDFPNYKAVLEQMTKAGKSLGKMMPGSRPDTMDPSSLPGMPIRTVVEMGSGGTITTEVVSVEEKDLGKELFVQPEGYKSMAMPGGMTPPTP